MTMTSAATIACLDTSIPVQITSESDFFHDICRHWGDPVTIVDQLEREAKDRARWAFQAALAAAEALPQPTFVPKAALRPTGPIPRITDMTLIEERPKPNKTDALVKIWDQEGERPVVNFIRKRNRLQRAWFRVTVFVAEIFS